MAHRSIDLVSVNHTPARAIMLVGQLLEKLHPEYDIVHVANSPAIESLEVVLHSLVKAPGILICSSQWTADEQEMASVLARKQYPQIKIINIPPGLDVREGGQAIVSFLESTVRSIDIPHSL